MIVMRQALLLARDWLGAAVTSRVFSPDAHPLVPHLVLPEGMERVTVAKAVSRAVQGKRALLPAGGGGE